MNIPPIDQGAWWTTPEWRSYATTLFRFYSSYRNVHVLFNTNLQGPFVNLQTKTVSLNPLDPIYFYKPIIPIRKTGLHRLHATLKETLAHEAAHLRYTSAEKPSGLLGHLTNMLEDERIERLLSFELPATKKHFDEGGDYLLNYALHQGVKGDSLEACLLWRWAHDTSSGYVPQESSWQLIKPLVEQAWIVPTTQDVITLAQQILDLLGLTNQEAKDDTLTMPSDPAKHGSNDSHASSSSDNTAEDENKKTGTSSDTPHADTSGSDDKTSLSDLDEPERQNGKQPSKKDSEGSGVGDEPTAPKFEPDDGLAWALSHMLPDSYAQHLARSLQPPTLPRTARPHLSRGEFNFESYFGKRERIFDDKRVKRKEKVPVSLLVDVSGSMGENNNPKTLQFHASQVALLLERACYLAGIEFTVTTFDRDAYEIRPKGMDHTQALSGLGKLGGNGGTRLESALKLLKNTRNITLILCDGDLEDSDVHACKHLVTKLSRRHLMPVLLGDAISKEATFKTIFDRSLIVRKPEDLSSTLESHLRAYQTLP
jgi:hypothetical protein